MPGIVNKIKVLIKYVLFLVFKKDDHSRQNIYYVSEGQGWVIEKIGKALKKIAENNKVAFDLIQNPKFIVNSIIHFGSLHCYLQARENKTNLHNKIIVTVFHGDQDINQEWRGIIERLILDKEKIARIIVPNSKMGQRAISWGIPADKVVIIPIGIDVAGFFPVLKDKKEKLRLKYGIPSEAICVGSFQKDGIGWGEGLEPKLIKGPDIFVEAVKVMAQKKKVHVLLAGPARGYVMDKLKEYNIPFTHVLAKDQVEMNDLYNCLDLYLITSREEGGPMGAMECMASGIPFVSTAVGMVPDLINKYDCGKMVEIENISALVMAADEILNDVNLRARIIKNGLESVGYFDWGVVGEKYYDLYRQLMN